MEEIQAGMGQLFSSYSTQREVGCGAGGDAADRDWGRSARGILYVLRVGNDGDHAKIGPVLEKFERYCQPHRHVPFERYRFNRCAQEAGESYDQYRTALRKLAEGCDFERITPDEILRDRLVFGIRDAKTRERLLHES